jgi:glycosyltransferase involved in cell wall biosynthesis
MPSYNRGYKILDSIKTIQAQTVDDWELVVVDDGSTDNTKELIEALGDERIHYVYQANKGPGAARNTGLGKVHSKWIAYLDSDNELFPEYAKTMLNWLNDNPSAVFAVPRAHRTQELYENGELVKLIDDSDDTPPSLTLHDIFMKSLHLDTNGFIHLHRLYNEGIRWSEDLHAMEDWELAMTIGERYPNGFLYVPVVLYNYHQRYGGDGVVSNSDYKVWADTFEKIYQRHKNDKLLEGQTWYPSRVEKWDRLQKEYDEGKLPPYYKYYFKDLV